MGKSNRIRTKRAAAIASAPVVKQKKGMPGWLVTAITIVLTVAILSSVVLGMLSSNGVFLRASKTMDTDNYKVTGTMMSYFFYNSYQSFYSTYSTYLSSGYFSLDTSKSLKSQQFGGDGSASVYDTMFLGSFSGTWFDYFMNEAKTYVKELLVYCEEADARGITLDESEIASINTEIELLSAYATAYGYPSANSYIAAMFGEGVSKNDVRKCLTLTRLAEKCANAIVEEFDEALPLDSKEIVDEFEKNGLDYKVIDYSYSTFSTSYDEAVSAVVGSDATADEKAAKKAEIEAKFLEMVNETKAKAAELQSFTTQSDFEAYILEDYLDTLLTTAYSVNSDISPVDSVVEVVKKELYNKVLAEVITEKSETVDDATYTEGSDEATLYGKEVTKAYAEKIFEIKKNIFSSLNTYKGNYFREDITYTDSEFFNWAFEQGENAGVRSPYEIKLTETGYKDGDEINSETVYTANVYMLTKTAAANSDPSRNLGFATFTTKDEANAFITALKEKGEPISFDDFKAVAEEKSAAAVDTVEDYIEGEMGVSALDTWAYGENTEIGFYSDAIEVDGAYVVFIYTGDGEEIWKVTVKNALLNDKITAKYNELAEKYAPVEYPKALNKIDG